MKKPTILAAFVAVTLAGAHVQARDIYISSGTGNDKNPGTKEEPKKLLWKTMEKLEAGDHLFVAEGFYHGQKKAGVMPKIVVGPVTIEGGWKADFSARDPFKYLSIITAAPDRQGDTHEVFQFEDPNGKGTPIVLDGFCIDRGPSLYYSGRGEGGPVMIDGHVDTSCWGYQAINRKKSGSDPTIELLGKGSFTVRNMLLINNPWWGIYVKAGGGGDVVIENNLILGYQGRGIEAITGGGWGKPNYIIRNNTVAFGASMEGRAISVDPRASYGTYLVEKNVLAYGAQSGVMCKFGGETLTMNDNLFIGFTGADFGDGGSPVTNAADFEDELTFDNEENVHETPKFLAKVSKPWLDRWSQWKGHESRFFTSDEVMEARKMVGLTTYELPFFAGKTYASYSELPPMRVVFDLSRYPAPFKKDQELMDWTKDVLPILGTDGARGVQPFAQ